MSEIAEKPASIQVNPNIQAQIKYVGKEKIPAVIIDDYALDTGDIIAYAHAQDFTTDPDSYYPGVRAILPTQYVIDVMRPLVPHFYNIYNIPPERKLKPRNIYFSLVTKPESELGLFQRLPHFDTPNPFYFAVLHYLSPGDHGGTGFFRHRPTGFESVDESRQQTYLQMADEYLKENGEPAMEYIRGSTDHYELFDEIAYKPNRLVFYPGNILHSGLLNMPSDIDSNPKTGRLTANIFLEFA